MSTVTIRMPTGETGSPADSWASKPSGPSHRSGGRHPKLVIQPLTYNDGQRPLTVPYAPVAASRAGLAPVYVRTARPGRADTYTRNNEPTPTMTLDLYFAAPDYRQSCAAEIARLEHLAVADAVILQGYDPAEVGPWFISSLSIDVSDRQPGSNEATRATAHVEFSFCTEGTIKHGPLSTLYSNGVGSSLTAPNSPTYTVRRGDTMTSIAVKIYGDPLVAIILAAVNGIKNPKSIRVGQVLKTPDLADTQFGRTHFG